MGDPIYSVADGRVKFAEDLQGGWGKVIRIDHYLPDPWKKEIGSGQIESLYAHCDEMLVQPGAWVKKGQQIGTIGNVNGLYYAHLHLEMRWNPNLDIGPGYAADTSGYLNPTQFIRNHRQLKE
ncbi:MAG: M23 family metallopeptidase [Bacteroidota bacterium]